MVINCKGIPLDLSMPKVMGIININEDSFYKNSRVTLTSQLIAKVTTMIDQGVSIIDIGAMSSRPGAAMIDSKAEWKILNDMIEAMSHMPIIISLDTVWAETASRAIDLGVHIINDISGGSIDEHMIPTVGAYGNVPYIMMHMRGTPENMHFQTDYNNMMMEIMEYFSQKLRLCDKSGIADVIIDPGFGFAKNIQQNYILLKKLHHFNVMEKAILVGISRKSMLYKLLKIDADNALNATTAAHMVALMNGAKILRVHDVKEALEAISIYNQVQAT